MTHRRQIKALRSKRIAFISASIHSGSSLKMWHPLVDEAERLGFELFFYPGGRLQAADPDESIRNRIFDYVADNSDGVVSWASALGGYVGAKELDVFHERFSRLPLVSIAHVMDGRSTIRIDAYSGMFPLLSHLHEVHGLSRFAYIPGPEEHESSRDRFRAFLDYHAQNGLYLDKRLIASSHPWNEGALGLQQLLDERKLVPGRDFDALLAASDLQLHDAVQLLRARSYAIPEDVKIAGFNDTIESVISSPSFTTVKLPFEEQALLALQDLCSLMSGVKIPPERVLDTQLIIRRSCGCMSSSVLSAGLMKAVVKSHDLITMDMSRPSLTDAVAQVLGAAVEDRSAWIDPLIKVFITAITQKDSSSELEFLQLLERILQRQIHLQKDLVQWQDVFSIIKRESACLSKHSERTAAENLIDKARVLIAEAHARMHYFEQWAFERRTHVLREFEKDLIRTQDRKQLGPLLARRMPELGIPAAYVMEAGEDGKAVCIAYFDNIGGRNSVQSGPYVSYHCRDGELVPGELFSSHPGASWIVEPLSGNGQFFGWMLIGLGVKDASVYEEIRGALSSALLGLRGIDIIRKAQQDAEKAEKLKTVFLANVSAEFIEPLHSIEEAAKSIIKGGENKTAGPYLSCPGTAEKILTLASRQLSLTRDVLELSRSEAGDLDLDVSLCYPEKLLWTAADSSVKDSDNPKLNLQCSSVLSPLLLLDPCRMQRLFVNIFKKAEYADCSWEFSRGALTFILQLSYADSAAEMLGHSTSRTIAAQIAAAHGGMLEMELQDSSHINWILKLPLPLLGSSESSFAKPEGPVYLLQTEPGIPAPLADFFTAGTDLQIHDPAQLLSFPDKIDDASAFCWQWSENEDVVRALIRALGRHPVAGTKPCLVFNEKLPSEESIQSLNILLQYDSTESSTVILYDPDPETRQEILRTFTSIPNLVPRTVNSLEEFETAFRMPGPVPLAVIKNISIKGLNKIKGFSKNGERPKLVVFLDAIPRSRELDWLLTEGRILLINTGILDDQELTHLIQSLLDQQASGSPYTGAIVKMALIYLNEHFSRSLVRWKIADAAHVSEDYLSRIFRKELGLSPWDYLTRLRIREAKKLLLEKPDSVASIAAACGFADQAYFCRVFRKTVGKPPLAFRKEGSHSS